MKKFRSFQCESGGVIERFVHDDTKVALCECGCFAKRTISTPRYLGNSTGKSPARH